MTSYKTKAAIIKTLTERLPKMPEHNSGAAELLNIANSFNLRSKALATMYETQSPMITRAAHDRKVAASAKKLAEQNKADFRKMHDALSQALKMVEHKIASKVNLKADERYAVEVRNIIRSLPNMGEKLRFLNRLAIENNGPELAAVVDAPAALSGIAKEDQDRYRIAILEMHAREEMEEQKTILDTFNQLLHVKDHANELATQLADPVRMAEIDRAEAAADAAEAAFDTALAPAAQG